MQPLAFFGLLSARAGIQSHGTAISVLSDNIANANTVGFKRSRANFGDILASSIGGGSGQGTLKFTGRGLDAGIQAAAGSGSAVLSTSPLPATPDVAPPADAQTGNRRAKRAHIGAQNGPTMVQGFRGSSS